MRWFRLLCPTVSAPALLVASCDTGSDLPTGGSNFTPPVEPREPPWGLGTIDLPADREAVVDTFSALPRRVLGVEWVDSAGTCFACASVCVSSPMQACYEDDEGLSFLRAGRVRDRTDVPARIATVRGWFRHEVPNDLAELGDVEDFDEDPTDGLLWAAGRPDRSYGWFRFYWGDPGSVWIFEAWSGSDQMREALVKAFVCTLRTPG